MYVVQCGKTLITAIMHCTSEGKCNDLIDAIPIYSNVIQFLPMLCVKMAIEKHYVDRV